MATAENIPKPELEQSIRKIAYHVTEGAVEASKLSENHVKDWMKEAHKYQWKYGRYGNRCGRPGRLFLGLAIGGFAGYHISKNYTVVQREHAEFVPGEGHRLHGYWREKKEQQQAPIEK